MEVAWQRRIWTQTKMSSPGFNPRPSACRSHANVWLRRPLHSSTTKAVCAASNKRPTTVKGAAGQTLDTMHALGLALAAGAERWTAMEGGYPIIFDGECVGGIGVSGATWEVDDTLAREAVEAIGAGYRIDNA